MSIDVPTIDLFDLSRRELEVMHAMLIQRKYVRGPGADPDFAVVCSLCDKVSDALAPAPVASRRAGYPREAA